MPQSTIESVKHMESDVEVPPSPARRRGLPLIALSGAAGKTSTGWILVHIFERAGLEVAAWLTGGVYVDRVFREDELHAWELATNAARAREIDILIQEVPSVLANNLSGGSISSAIFTSICGSDGQCRREAGAERDRHAVEAVSSAIRPRGRAIVNADDPMVIDGVAGGDFSSVLYALNLANPAIQDHLHGGGDGCWVDDGWLMAQVQGRQLQIIRTSDIPASLDGNLLFQVQNTLAATAAALPLIESGLEIGPILSSMASNDPKRRGGVREICSSAGRILVDSPQSIMSIRQIARGVRAYHPHRVILALDDFETFSDEDAFEAARILGSIAGIAILVGSTTNERRIEILKSGLMRSSTPPAIIFRDRMDLAVGHARSLLGDRDLALVLNPRPDNHVRRGVSRVVGAAPGQ